MLLDLFSGHTSFLLKEHPTFLLNETTSFYALLFIHYYFLAIKSGNGNLVLIYDKRHNKCENFEKNRVRFC